MLMLMPCFYIKSFLSIGMRLPAREAAVASGTRNPFQFNFLGATNNLFRLGFGQSKGFLNHVRCWLDFIVPKFILMRCTELSTFSLPIPKPKYF